MRKGSQGAVHGQFTGLHVLNSFRVSGTDSGQDALELGVVVQRGETGVTVERATDRGISLMVRPFPVRTIGMVRQANSGMLTFFG